MHPLSNLSNLSFSMSSSSSKELEHPALLPNWLELPKDVTVAILNRLETRDILEVVQWVCMPWYSACKDPSMWQSINIIHKLAKDTLYMEKMCRNAVDQSCGQLKHINLQYFGTDELIHYIADQAPQLRSLRLVSCNLVSEIGLREVAKRLENLEELHMFLIDVPKQVLESFGRCCPHLKYLTYNLESSLILEMEERENENALAIAQTMPGLRHLSLFNNEMTNDGLHAILNHCLHLESLDLRQCLNIDLGGDLGRSCSQKIKNLKRPDEFDTSKYEPYEHSSSDDLPSRFSETNFMAYSDDDYHFFCHDLEMSPNDYFGLSPD